MRKRLLSVLCSLVLFVVMFCMIGFHTNAENVKNVDGSFLTEQGTSTATAILKTRGIYLQTGDCTITSAGRGRVYIYGSTTANNVVDYLTVTVILEQYNEITENWNYVDSINTEATNDYHTSVAKTILVDRGYYYRVRATHSAGPIDGDRDVADSITDGIKIR